MRILIVVHGYPPYAVGGTEIYADSHARALVRRGDEVVVLARESDPGRAQYAVREEKRDAVRVVFVNNTFRDTRSFEDTYSNAVIGRIADELLDDVQPDVAHIHHLTGLSTTIVGSLARRSVPAFMTLHDYWLICHRGQLLNPDYALCDGPGERGCRSCVGLAGGLGTVGFAGAAVVRTLERTLPSGAANGLRRVAERVASAAAGGGVAEAHAERRLRHMREVCDGITGFFAPSLSVRDRFVAFGVRPDRITLAPYGIETNHRGTEAQGRQHNSPRVADVAVRPRIPGVLRLGFLGSLMVSKAPHILLEAAARLPAGSVVVDLYGSITAYHGDDRYRTTLEPLLARDGVTMHGPLAHDRVPDALASLDALVVPSIWPENSPFVIHEAFRAGVPVVASRIGGIRELVEDGRNGLLFEPGSVDDLARAIGRLANERDVLETLQRGIPPVRSIDDDVSFTRGHYGKRPGTRHLPKLAAIVLNYQTPDDTLLAVRALLASDRHVDDLIVVNNGRPEARGELHAALATLAPAVTVLHAGANLGFSGGMNIGVRAAIERGAGRVLLVNSDVIVPPDCIQALEDALATSPGAGIAGPAILARTDPGRIVSLGIAYSHTTGRMRHHGFGTPASDSALPRAQVVDAVSGCVMLVARPVLEAIGRLDDDYFFSFEDVDFCIRARQAGFSSIVAGRARVYHEGNRSIGPNTPARLYFAARNHLRLARRANASAVPFGIRAAPIVALNIAHAVRASGGSLPARLAAVFKGTRDYALGRFGAGAESRRLTP